MRRKGVPDSGPKITILFVLVAAVVAGSAYAAPPQLDERRARHAQPQSFELVIVTPAAPDATDGIGDGPDIFGRHGKKRSGSICSDRATADCISACFVSATRQGKALAAVDCTAGPEITGEYMNGTLNYCTCITTGGDGISGYTPPPPPMTSGF